MRSVWEPKQCGCVKARLPRGRARPTPHDGSGAHVTHIAPLVQSPYEDLAMTCPHGVTWHTEPTGEQREKWAREGVA